jgi:hypothetical protein
MTALAQCCRQTPFGLRQYGTFQFIRISIFALYERKNEIQKKTKHRCERSLLGNSVSPVIEERRNI